MLYDRNLGGITKLRTLGILQYSEKHSSTVAFVGSRLVVKTWLLENLAGISKLGKT